MIRSNYKKIVYLFTAFVLVGNVLLAPALNMQEIQSAKAATTPFEISGFHITTSYANADHLENPEIIYQFSIDDVAYKYEQDHKDAKLFYVMNFNDLALKNSDGSFKPEGHFQIKISMGDINYFSLPFLGSQKYYRDNNTSSPLTWGHSYKVELEYRDENLDPDKDTLGYKKIDPFEMKEPSTNGTIVTGSGPCPPTSPTAKAMNYNDGRPKFIIGWKFNQAMCTAPGELSHFEIKGDGGPWNGYSGTVDGDPTTATGLRDYQIVTDDEKQTTESTKFTITTIYKSTAGVESKVGSSVVTPELADSKAQGDVPAGGANSAGTEPDACKDKYLTGTSIIDVGKYISYAICFVGNLIITAFEKLAHFALDSLQKVAQISDARFSPSFVPTAHAAESQNLAEAVKSNQVKNIWMFSISFVDVIIIVSIIIVAFSQILNLQIDSYTIKKSLPGLIFGIIGANLSYFIILGMLDISQIFSVEIINRIGGTTKISEGLGQLMGLSFGTGTALGAAGAFLVSLITANVFFIILAALLGIIILLLPAILIILLTILLYWRIYMILILTAIAPLAFISIGIPQASQYFKMWWKNLFNWIAIAPVVFFLLALASAFKSDLFLNSSYTTDGTNPPTDLGQFGGWVLGMILLSAAFTIPLKMLGGPVGQAIASFAKSSARSAQKFGMRQASHNFNKSRFYTNKKLDEVKAMKTLEAKTTRTAEENAKLAELKGKYSWGRGGDVQTRSFLQNVLSAPTDWSAGSKVQEEHFKKQADLLSVRSNAYQTAAGDRAGNRSYASSVRGENEGLMEPALRNLMDKEAYGKRISQAIQADITKNGATSEFNNAEWAAVQGHIASGDYEEAGKAFDTVVSAPNANLNNNIVNGSKNVSSWMLKNAMGSPDGMVDSRETEGISIDRLDALKLGVYLQDIMQRHRSSRGRGGQNVMFEIGNANPNPYTTEGSESPSQPERRAGLRQSGGNTAPEENIMPELDLDEEFKSDMVANLKVVPTLDDGALEGMSNKIRQRVTSLRMKNGVTNPVSDQELARAKAQIKTFHDEFHKQQDNNLDERVSEQYDGVLEGMRSKVDRGVQFDPKALHKEAQTALNEIDLQIKSGSKTLGSNEIKLVQDLMPKLVPSTLVSASNLTELAQRDAKAVREQLSKYEKVLSGLVGKNNITSADIQLSPKMTQDAKLDLKTQDVKSELGKLESKLGDQLKTAIHTSANSTTPLDQAWIKPIQASLAQTARAQGLQLGEQNMESATRELLTAIDQHFAQGGNLNQLNNDQLKQNISQSLGKHSIQTQQVQGTYGNGGGIK